MPRFGLALLLAALVTPHACGQLTETVCDTLIRDALSVWAVPGAAVVIVDRDKVLYLKGHGVRELNRTSLVSGDTVFPIASCTKAFTTAAVASLSDEGKLDWNDPVRKHLADFHLNDPTANGDVRLRDLASHRTGLASHDLLWYRAPWPVAEVVRRAGLLPLAQPFRSEFQYQNAMVMALGQASARVVGKPWEEIVRTRLFEPLGMKSATAIAPPLGGDLASPHREDGGTLVPIPRYEQREPNPAGSIHASARDLGQWLRFHLGDGRFDGKKILSEAALRELHAPQIVQRLIGIVEATHPETVLSSYALGWVSMDYRGQLMWAHTGVIDGFRAQIAILPRTGYAVAVLSNRHDTRMNLALANTILDRLVGAPAREWNNHLKRVVEVEESIVRTSREYRDRDRQPMVRPAADYAGTYDHPAYGPCRVQVEGERLIWSWSAFREPMKHYRGNEFDLINRDLRDPAATFVERGGKMVGLKLFDVEFARKD